MPFDPAILRQIREVGGADLEREMFEIFLANAPGRLDALRAALAAADPEEIADSAHSILSSASSLGARELARRARELEREARAGRGAALEELYAGVEQAVVEVLGALRVRLAE